MIIPEPKVILTPATRQARITFTCNDNSHEVELVIEFAGDANPDNSAHAMAAKTFEALQTMYNKPLEDKMEQPSGIIDNP